MDISHEQYVAAYNALPKPIADYIMDGKVDTIVADIGNKYSFHVDIVGEMAQGATYMLMGLMSPAELLGELVMAEIDTGVAKSVLAELNQRIFIPIREEVHKQTEAPAEQEREETPAPAPVAASPAPAPTEMPVTAEPPAPSPISDQPAQPAYAEPPQAVAPQRPAVVAPPPPPAPQLAAQPAPMQSPVPVAPPVASVPYPVELPHARTMAGDMQMASEGLHDGAATPARSFQTASVPVTSSFPRQTPPAPAQNFATPAYSPAAPQSVPQVPQAPRPEVPLTREYGNDPYREPVA